MQDSLRLFKAEFFKALAHPVRIRILELLREGELSVNELQARLEMEPSGVSQQLAILRSRNIVESRKDGTSVYYRVRDPQVFALLDVARRIFTHSLANSQSMLAQLNEEQAQIAKHKTRHIREGY
jgi:DNA-binding transcriptional ArsR family regulator